MTEQAQAILHIDNEQTRVTEYRFAPGATTGFHRHDYDYVITPLTDGRLRLVGADGKEVHADLTVGKSYFRKAGVEHDVFNAGDKELKFVEVEWKG